MNPKQMEGKQTEGTRRGREVVFKEAASCRLHRIDIHKFVCFSHSRWPTMADFLFFYKQTFRLNLLCLLTIIIAITESSSACSMDPGLVKPSTPLVSFLERVQETAFTTLGNSNFDPKSYVDLPLKFNLSETEDAFDKLAKSANGSVTAKDLNGFVERYLDTAGDDLEYWEPEDFVAEPEGFLPKVEHPEVRAWALKVHSLWKNLSRRVSSGVKNHPHLHTLLPLPAPFIIPGSRFREVYYWDSYWVIRCLHYLCFYSSLILHN